MSLSSYLKKGVGIVFYPFTEDINPETYKEYVTFGKIVGYTLNTPIRVAKAIKRNMPETKVEVSVNIVSSTEKTLEKELSD